MLKKLNADSKKNLLTYAAVIAVYAAIMLINGTVGLSDSTKGFLVPLCIYAIMAVSLNLVVGILGELSLGHAGFMCIGAYSSAIFSKCTENVISAPLRFTLAILIGAVCAAVFGILIGIPVLRLRGDYLAIVTLAFGEIIKNLVNVIYLGLDESGMHFSLDASAVSALGEGGKVIIKGAQGISGTPQDSNFTIGTLLLLITLFVVLNLINSRSGRAIAAIRDNRIAAESVGINITKYKLMVFTLSAALAGSAGVLYSHNFAVLTAAGDKFNYNASIMILVYVVLGGIGSIRGSVIAAVVLYLLPEKLRFLSSYRMLVYAVVLIAVMLFSNNERAKAFTERLFGALKRLLSAKKGESAE